jgi:hypothetical protein
MIQQRMATPLLKLITSPIKIIAKSMLGIIFILKIVTHTEVLAPEKLVR